MSTVVRGEFWEDVLLLSLFTAWGFRVFVVDTGWDGLFWIMGCLINCGESSDWND